MAICILIFIFSSQNGTSSGNISEGMTRSLFPSILSDDVIYVLEKIIRKIAHYGIYFALGITVYFAFSSYFRGFSEKIPSASMSIIIPVLICFVYSITDELHQTLVPDRNGAFSDCLLDTLGALSGVMFVRVVSGALRKLRKK